MSDNLKNDILGVSYNPDNLVECIKSSKPVPVTRKKRRGYSFSTIENGTSLKKTLENAKYCNSKIEAYYEISETIKAMCFEEFGSEVEIAHTFASICDRAYQVLREAADNEKRIIR